MDYNVFYIFVQKWKTAFTFGLNAARKYTLFQKKLQIKVFRHRILYKKVREGICLSPPRVGLGCLKDEIAKILNCIETENCINFWAERCRKYALFQKKFQIKVFRIEFRTKKSARAYVYLPPGWS